MHGMRLIVSRKVKISLSGYYFPMREQPQALSEQVPNESPPSGFAGMHGATRNDVGVIGRLGSHLDSAGGS